MEATPSAPAAPAAAAPATPPATPAPAAPAETPKITPSQAGKTLNELRAERRSKLEAPKKDEKKPEEKAPADKPAEETPAAAKADDKPEPKEAKPDEDETLARLIAEDRRIKGEAKKVEEARAELAKREEAVKGAEKDVAAVNEARAAFAKGDEEGAVRAILGDEAAEKLFWRMQQGEMRKPAPLDPEKLVELAAKKLEEKQAAEAAEAKKKADEKAAEEAKAEAAAQADYLKECDAAFNADPAKYPAIHRMFKTLKSKAGGVVAEEIVERFSAHVRKTGAGLSVAEVLAAVEADFAAADPAPAPAPSPTMTSGWKSDAGRPAPAEPKTLEEKRAARREALQRRA